jgi:hypothetical protein
MHCPNDNAVLQMTTREGIEIDYCPTCRGVWLDRGELDKLIERGASYGGAPSQQVAVASTPDRHSQPQQQYRPYDDDDDHHGGHHEDNRYNHGHHKKKKEGFLGDLFDF